MVNAFDQLKCHVAAHERGNSQSVLLLHPLCRGLGQERSLHTPLATDVMRFSKDWGEA